MLKKINELKKDNLMSGYIWFYNRGDNISIHTNQNGRLDFLTAMLLFCDVTLCCWGYTGTKTSQNNSFLKRQCGDF